MIRRIKKKSEKISMLMEQMNRLERMEYENRLENGITETEGHNSSSNGMQPPNAHCHETNTSEREVSK